MNVDEGGDECWGEVVVVVKTVMVLTIDERSDGALLLGPAVGGPAAGVSEATGAEDEDVVVGADDSVAGGGEDFVVGAVIDKSVGSAK